MFRENVITSSVIKLVVAVVAGSVLFGCATSQNKGVVTKAGEIERQWVEVEGITSDYVFARGIGAADQALQNKTQKMATSRNASIVNAQYNMLSIIRGAMVSGGITVEKSIESDSSLTAKVEAVIKSAEIVRSEWTADDGCVVLLRLPKKALQGIGLSFGNY
jgi:hypothetical protein